MPANHDKKFPILSFLSTTVEDNMCKNPDRKLYNGGLLEDRCLTIQNHDGNRNI